MNDAKSDIDQKKVLEASLRVNMQYLKMITDADTRGHICNDLDSLLYSLDMFELFSKKI